MIPLDVEVMFWHLNIIFNVFIAFLVFFSVPVLHSLIYLSNSLFPLNRNEWFFVKPSFARFLRMAFNQIFAVFQKQNIHVLIFKIYFHCYAHRSFVNVQF